MKSKAERLKDQIRKERLRFKELQKKKKEKEEVKQLKKDKELLEKEIAIATWKDFFKKNKQDRVLVINMELANKQHDTFLIAEKGNSFKHKGKRYIFDNKMMYYNIKFKLWCYDYHEDFTMPIKREFPKNETNIAIQEGGMINTEYATNPSTLERFMQSSIIEMMLRGGAIDKTIKLLVVIVAIALVIGLIHLIVYLQQSGVFEGLM